MVSLPPLPHDTLLGVRKPDPFVFLMQSSPRSVSAVYRTWGDGDVNVAVPLRSSRCGELST